jgi:hypothetical protein
MMETPKAVYLRQFLEMRLVAELLTVPKRVMVCWVCMVFLLLPGYAEHTPEGAQGALLPSRGMAALPREEVSGKGPGACGGGRSPTPGGRGTRVLNLEPKGAAPAPARWPSDRATGECAELA